MDLKLIGLYIGPDQMMPVASILATIMGFLLIFWGKLIVIIRKIFRLDPPPMEEQRERPPDSPTSSETPKKN